MSPALQPIGLEAQPITWGSDGEPHSELFDDCFYPPGDGLKIARHTFLSPNQIPERLDKDCSIVVGEIGFGTGLNLFATLEDWTKKPKQNGILHFISFEKYLMSADEIKRSLRSWPQLQKFLNPFCDRVPPRAYGVFRVPLPEFRAFVTLHIGDARATLKNCVGQVDAWYLDGFAPSRNPELWSEVIFKEIARLSHTETTLSTFSAAGHVRRGLQQVGFQVQKIPGFGTKRDSIKAQFSGSNQSPILKDVQRSKKIAVIGAGIAGASLVHSLRLRGADVTLFERNAAPALEGSGNPQAILIPYLSAYGGHLHDLYLGGFHYSQALYQYLDSACDSFIFKQSGVIQNVFDRRTTTFKENLSALHLPPELMCFELAEKLSSVSGISLKEDAFFYPQGAYFNPQAAASLLIKIALEPAAIRMSDEITEIKLEEDAALIFSKASAQPDRFDTIIVSSAHNSSCFSPIRWLPLSPLRGQIISVKPSHLSSALKVPICGHGYIIPATMQGTHTIGASFERGVENLDENLEISSDLCDSPAQWSSDLEFSIADKVASRCSYRASTPDRTPLVGNVSISSSSSYRELIEGLSQDDSATTPLPNLFVSAGFGSRGMSSAPLAAEIICSKLYNEPLPCAGTLEEAVEPQRFIKRALKKLNRR